jgi:hypothetical protein
VLIVLFTIAIIGTSLVAFLSSVKINAETVVGQAKALYLAEAGIAQAIHLLRSQADAAAHLGDTIGPVSLGEGTFTVKIDFTQSLITSQGNVQGTTKIIQLQYRAL